MDNSSKKKCPPFQVPSIEELDRNDSNNQILSQSLFNKHKCEKNINQSHGQTTCVVDTVRSSVGSDSKAKSSDLMTNEFANDLMTDEFANDNKSEDSSIKTVSPGKLSSSTNAVLVSSRQRGNPLLKHIFNVPYEFSDIIPDYVMSPKTCALYLSLKYHLLNPNYIHERLKQLGYSYQLRILLVQIDVKDSNHSLKDLAKICILSDCTLMVAWSPEEAGRYIETYKSYENKPADLIMEKVENNFMGRVTEFLTAFYKINKTDAVNLLSSFRTIGNILNATEEDLSFCPGIGPGKASRLYKVLNEPFLKSRKKTKTIPDNRDEDEIAKSLLDSVTSAD